MPLNPAGYPLDLTGIAPSNFITNEIHVINTPRDRLFVPGGGPFYHIGFSIRNSSNNQLLLPNTDYKLLHLHKPAARDSGKDVYTVVYIINETVNSVTIDYHVVGGIHGETADVIRTLLESFPLPDDGDSVAWGQIIGIPTQFTPAEHVHHIDEIYNFNDVVSVLEQLRIAILAGDGPAINAIYQYFHQYLTNADYVTRDELLGITSIVPFFEIKSFPDYDTLRNATTMINGAPGIYCCLGRDNMFDRNGRIFLWDINATAPHNGDTIVRPHIIPNDTVNGRFISFQRVEKDLNLLASSLQRSINFDGTIEDGIINNGRVVLVDADNYLRDGTYWVGDANTIANVPFSWCVMKVDNIVVASNSTNGEVIQTFYNGLGDKATRRRYYDALSAGYIWGPLYWYARREGDAAINFNVKDATQPDHAVTLRQLTTYGGNSTVQFLVSDATQPDHAVTLRQTLDMDMECHLGIVVRHIGNTSILLPCYIGESGSHGNLVKVYISGALRLVNLADISPLYVGDDTDLVYAMGYVYLVRDPSNGGYSLTACHFPPEDYIYGNMTSKRKRLRMSPNIVYDYSSPITPEDTTLIGVVSKKGLTPKWDHVRSWFQDPGMVEHTGFYNSPRDNLEALPKVSGPLARLDYDDSNYCDSLSMTNFYSPFYNRLVNGIEMILWPGEVTKYNLEANTAIDHPSAGLRGMTVQLILRRMKNVLGLGTADLQIRANGVTGTDYANAKNLGIYQPLSMQDGFVAPELGVYAAIINGQTSASDTKGYLIGAHSSGISRSTLLMAVEQYHAYRNLVIAAITPAGQTLVLTINTTRENIDIYNDFINTYGLFTSYPLLQTLVVDVQNGALVGSTSVYSGSMFIDDLIPASVNVVVNVYSGALLLGKGGQGAANRADAGSVTAEPGGDAIVTERSITVNTYGGTLGGGGGGGQRGRAASSGATGSEGGPGGGGAGYQIGQAGAQIGANNAANGGTYLGGFGGTAIFSGPVNENFSLGDDGGRGGDLGQAGSLNAGNAIAPINSVTAPGAAGRAVKVSPGYTASVTMNIVGGAVYGSY